MLGFGATQLWMTRELELLACSHTAPASEARQANALLWVSSVSQ
jgi:hypothetical protein